MGQHQALGVGLTAPGQPRCQTPGVRVRCSCHDAVCSAKRRGLLELKACPQAPRPVRAKGLSTSRSDSTRVLPPASFSRPVFFSRTVFLYSVPVHCSRTVFLYSDHSHQVGHFFTVGRPRGVDEKRWRKRTGGCAAALTLRWRESRLLVPVVGVNYTCIVVGINYTSVYSGGN